MNNIQTYTSKREYCAPQLTSVQLDNDIALALQSAPPAGPDEANLLMPNHSAPSPFNT